MKAASLLILLLSNQGYWLGDQGGTITIRPAARGGLPAAVISWKLMLDGVQIQSARTPLAADDSDTVIRIIPPTPRVRVTLHWIYDVVASDGGKSLEQGECFLSVFPTDLLDRLPRRLARKQLAVWDKREGLRKLLDRLHVPYLVVDSGTLRVARPDIVVVGQDEIDSSPFTQSAPLALAQSGTSVMIFKQTIPSRLMGYDLAERVTPARLEWRTDHPLLASFRAEDLASWTVGARQLLAVRLPAEEPALEIGYYSREVAGKESGPIDAVLVSKTVGKGRFVLCQIPLGDWSTDPRSQILLSNAIDYLLTPPQPTPRPGDRQIIRPAASQPVRTIEIPEGVEP